MVLKLYGANALTCFRRAKTILEELGLKYEIVELNLGIAEHKSEPYLEKQPFGQMPLLDDDGFIVYESRAICLYLAQKYYDPTKTNLIPDPTDLKANAKFFQAFSVELSGFEPAAVGICFEKAFGPMRGIPPNEEQVKKHVDALKVKLQGYERILSKQKYIAANEITLIDLFHLPHGTLAEQFFPELFEEHPHVSKWWKELKARPSWIKTNTL